MNSLFRQYGFFVSVVLLQSIYFITALHYGNICNGDTFEYIYEAVNILERGFFYCGNPVLPIQEEYMTLRTPVYPLFIAGIYFFSVNNFVVLFFQNLISLLNIYLARKIFKTLGYHRRMDVWFFLLLFLFPGQFVYANVLSPDVLLQTCSILYFHYVVLYLKDRKKVIYTFKMALALLVGMFVKPVLYPFVIIHLLVILILGLKDKVLNRGMLLNAFLPILCLIAYNSVNKTRTGKFHFSSIQSVNALYNHLCYYQEKEGFEKGEAFIAEEKSTLDRLPTFNQRYEYSTKRGMELLKENFASYMMFHLKKSVTFFLQTGKGELDQFVGKLTLAKIYTGKSQTIIILLKEKNVKGMIQYMQTNPFLILGVFTFITNILKLIGVYFFIRLTKNDSIIKWFISLYLLYFALITGPVSNAHYTMPISLIIMCCAITGYLYRFNKTSLIKQVI